MQTKLHPGQAVFGLGNKARNRARLLLAGCALLIAAGAHAEDPVIRIGTTNYQAYRTSRAAGDWVYVDADSAGETPVRAMQRSLGYREVDYKSYVTVVPFVVGTTALKWSIGYTADL